MHAAVDGRLRAKTARDYRTLLARYVRPELGQVKLSRLKPLDLQSLLLSLTNRGLSARTVRYTHAVLRSALDQARRWKLLVENPAADMPLPRADKREFRVLTPEEAQRFTSFCREDPAGLVFLVALTTGLRPSEYLAIRAEDFDRHRATLTITRTLERAKGDLAVRRNQAAAQPADRLRSGRGRSADRETYRHRRTRTKPVAF